MAKGESYSDMFSQPISAKFFHNSEFGERERESNRNYRQQQNDNHEEQARAEMERENDRNYRQQLTE